jgi:hypothetical protein
VCSVTHEMQCVLHPHLQFHCFLSHPEHLDIMSIAKCHAGHASLLLRLMWLQMHIGGETFCQAISFRSLWLFSAVYLPAHFSIRMSETRRPVSCSMFFTQSTAWLTLSLSHLCQPCFLMWCVPVTVLQPLVMLSSHLPHAVCCHLQHSYTHTSPQLLCDTRIPNNTRPVIVISSFSHLVTF